MTDSLSRVLRIPDPRLADEAVSARPVWLWSEDGARLLWANPAALAIFGADSVTALSTRLSDHDDQHRQQIINLAPRVDETSRLQRLRGFGARAGGLMTCACLRLTIADGTTAMAITAIDPVSPGLSLTERLQMLVRDVDAPVAAYSASGQFFGASASAQDGRADTLIIGTTDAATTRANALRDGSAPLETPAGSVALHRIGHGENTGLIAVWLAAPISTSTVAPAPQPLPAHEPTARAAASQPQRPMRFLWQMDAQNRFSLGSDGFSRLIGLATTAAFGRPWHEINAALQLDPDNRVAQAVSTRNTFSGLTVMWPLDGTDTRLPVTLSALPVLDQDSRFVGYQGFGVCDDLDLLAKLGGFRRDEAMRRLQRVAVQPPQDQDQDQPASERKAAAAPAYISEAPNTASASPVLSPVENSTFNELGRQLSERLEHPEHDPAREPPSSDDHPARAPQEPANSSLPDAERLAEDLSAILDVVEDSAITLAADGRILACNRSAETLFGYRNADIAQHTIFDLLAVDAHLPTRKTLAHVVSDGTPAPRVDVQGRTNSGRVIPLAMTIARAGPEQGTLFAVFRDSAGRKRLETEMHDLRKQAERAVQARTDMLEWISQEVRTPADIVAGYADVMVDETYGAVGNERYLTHLRDIRGAARQIVTTLDEVRDLARIEGGEFEFDFAPQSLNAAVEQSIATKQATAKEGRVVIRPAPGQALPPVTADHDALRQITDNLIALSIDLAGAGGQVIVSTLLSDSGDVMLRVRDTGVSLDPDDIATINETSRLLNVASHPRLTKSGINLPLTKALIQANRAYLGIRKAPNSGTLIEVTFAAA